MLNAKHLPNEIPGEQIAHFLRRHPITILGLIFGYIFLLLAPIIIYYLLTFTRPTFLDNQNLAAVLVLASSVAFLFIWLFLFQAFSDYYLDIWIVTSKRVLNIEQVGLFTRRVSELRLYRVQDVTATVSGVAHTIFNYGNVEIQTAGEKERFIFEDVSDPNMVAKTILQLAEADRREHLDEAVEEFGIADSQKNKN